MFIQRPSNLCHSPSPLIFFVACGLWFLNLFVTFRRWPVLGR